MLFHDYDGTIRDLGYVSQMDGPKKADEPLFMLKRAPAVRRTAPKVRPIGNLAAARRALDDLTAGLDNQN